MAVLVVTAIGQSGGNPASGHLNLKDAVYATAQTGAGAVSNPFGIQVGQTNQAVPTYQVSRSGLAFDTSAIPVGASIASAVLALYGWSDISTTDFNLTIVSGADLADLLVDADFQELLNDTTSFGAMSTSGFVEGGWNNITLNATGIAAISTTGTTRFGLRSSRDISATTPTDDELIQFETPDTTSWPTAHAPTLTITYYGDRLPGDIRVVGNDLVYVDHSGVLRTLTGV